VEKAPKRTLAYMHWDDYSLGKLVDYQAQGLTQREMAEKFAVNYGSVSNIIIRIRQSKPGSTLYQYRKYFVEEE